MTEQAELISQVSHPKSRRDFLKMAALSTSIVAGLMALPEVANAEEPTQDPPAMILSPEAISATIGALFGAMFGPSVIGMILELDRRTPSDESRMSQEDPIFIGSAAISGGVMGGYLGYLTAIYCQNR